MVAYLNSSLGSRLNKKCYGSHIHTPCSGQNTSITEGYTPKIVRIVHECFRDDVRSGKFDVPTYASAAVHKHFDRFDVPTYDLGSVPKYIESINLIAAVSRPKPAPRIGAKHRANLPMASWTEIFEEMDRAEPEDADTGGTASGSAAYGDYSVDPAVGDATGNTEADDTAGAASGSATAGDDNVEGQKERWRAIDNARFVPDLDSKKKLLETLESNNTYKAAYGRLRHVILFCEFIDPSNKFYDVKMGTIATPNPPNKSSRFWDLGATTLKSSA